MKKFVFVGLTILALIGGADRGSGQTAPAAQPSPEAVAKLIAQLGAADFPSRDEATDKLEKLGGPVLPALRKAVTTSNELEFKRRIELLVTRIENALLKTEENRWQDLDAPRHAIKDRLVKILVKTPELSDQQVTSAIYLLTVGRSPTSEELKRAERQFAETEGRPASILQLARSLVQSKEYSADTAAANGRLFKAQKDLAGEMVFVKMLHRLNGDEFQKLTGDVAVSVDKAVKNDERLVDLAFLLVLSRFPKANESTTALGHLQKAKNRPTAASDIFWALMNSKEFLMGG